MALQELTFHFNVENPTTIQKEWVHSGVVGSGDLEILMERQNSNGAVDVKVVTPVNGFNHVWQKVLEKFITEKHLGDVKIEINDNNATPSVVSLRLAQAFIEANKLEKEVG
ncbi:malonate decarboxylase acyl carrier protein [Neobacillus sp. LXY-4]|uniref:malonate decarboxylase acyl carrier protein n=1 Tax=Neobacillus sp. LXY-4 TaxID=3379826 RepID=UPI003EE0D962